jgi:integrase
MRPTICPNRRRVKWLGEEVRAFLGHTRIDTTQVYARIRPAQLKRAVAFYEDAAAKMLGA